jgi:hypothetical protein
MTYRNVRPGARQVVHCLAVAIVVAATMLVGVATAPGTAHASGCVPITDPLDDPNGRIVGWDCPVTTLVAVHVIPDPPCHRCPQEWVIDLELQKRISPATLPAVAGELDAAIDLLDALALAGGAEPDPMAWQRDKALGHLAEAAAQLGNGAPLTLAGVYAQGVPTPEPAIGAMTAFGKDLAAALNLLAAAHADPANADQYRSGAEVAFDRLVGDLAAARAGG